MGGGEASGTSWRGRIKGVEGFRGGGAPNFTGAHKTRGFQRHPPLPHVMYLAASKTLRTGPYKS